MQLFSITILKLRTRAQILFFFSAGWGKIKHPGTSHNILQQAQMPPVTNEQCAAKLGASPGKFRQKHFTIFL